MVDILILVFSRNLSVPCAPLSMFGCLVTPSKRDVHYCLQITVQVRIFLLYKAQTMGLNLLVNLHLFAYFSADRRFLSLKKANLKLRNNLKLFNQISSKQSIEGKRVPPRRRPQFHIERIIFLHIYVSK